MSRSVCLSFKEEAQQSFGWAYDYHIYDLMKQELRTTKSIYS
uniref:Uncharacterized protein n=1 Tax=Triticum urartu TaxID=4572 RepID=A0A8R7Q4F9_TRIUA